MKNIVILIGSPRREGNTATLSRILIEHLYESDYNINIFHLYENEIKACLDCRNCKIGALRCTVDDDMQKIYTAFDHADFIIFGTPIYWFGPSAKSKLVLDRMRPYFGNKLLSGKKGALLLAAGEGEKDCDLTIEMFKRSFAALEMEYIGAVISKSYDIGEAGQDISAINSAKDLAKIINEI